MRLNWQLPYRLCVVFSTFALLSGADQVVSLERAGTANGAGIIFEPLFNPKSISASVGEKIHFQASLLDVSSLPVDTPLIVFSDY
jgi:hypothetical protein